eukprot:Nk52_evm18s160 gene=Nk52_evmTU18s160
MVFKMFAKLSFLFFLLAFTSSSSASPVRRSNSTEPDRLFRVTGNSISPQIKGINLGGWLLSESWMVDNSMYNGLQGAKEEHNLCQSLTTSVCKERLDAHQKEFIVPSTDIPLIKKAGFNFVRVPVGYWLTTKDSSKASPYPAQSEATIQVLNDLFDATDANDIGVMLDLHGVINSQNGFDNSGWSNNPPQWTVIDWAQNELFTVDNVKWLTETFHMRKSFVGVELVNEPLYNTDLGKLKDYYYKGYEAVRSISDNAIVFIHDTFRPYNVDDYLPRGDGYHSIVVDSHSYGLWNPAITKFTIAQHIQYVKDNWTKQYNFVKERAPVICGEWSLGLDPPAFAGLSPEEKNKGLVDYFNAQRDIFTTSGDGFTFWSWKLFDHNDLWSFIDINKNIGPLTV